MSRCRCGFAQKFGGASQFALVLETEGDDRKPDLSLAASGRAADRREETRAYCPLCLRQCVDPALDFRFCRAGGIEVRGFGFERHTWNERFVLIDL